MTDETKAEETTTSHTPEEPADPTGTGEQAAAPDGESAKREAEKLSGELFDELTLLGNRFVEVVQAAWNSDERKRIEADLKKGLNTLAENVEEGFQKVSENQKTQQTIDKADRVAEDVGNKIRGNEAVNDIARSLTKGLHALANTLEDWTREIQERDAAVDSTASAGEDGEEIPIERGDEKG